ncbi:MAG: hypothetical protein NPMRTHETA2_1080005 [Nitrosopumilales archaeon]|nr:MAG: hypothetical protein NPMRTHETA2_1080005 [Nitrosopumilales archaeon]
MLYEIGYVIFDKYTHQTQNEGIFGKYRKSISCLTTKLVFNRDRISDQIDQEYFTNNG